MEFFEQMQAHLCLRGNAYAEIMRGRGGNVDQLIPLHPSRVLPEQLPTGRIRYRVSRSDGSQVVLLQDEVLHVRALSANGVVGMSPIEMQRNTIGLGLAADAFGSSFFRNDARPGGVLQHPTALSPDAVTKIRESWNKAHRGVGNANSVAILWEGMEWKQIGMPLKDAQFLESRQYQASEIARIFRVPPHIVGILDKATFSNIEQQSIEFATHCIRPWLERWEQALERALLDDLVNFTIEIDHNELVRGDAASTASFNNLGVMGGWLTRNEARERVGKNPLDGLDDPLTPLNMDSGAAKDSTVPTNQPSRPKGYGALSSQGKAENPWLRMAIDDAASRLAKAEARELEKTGGGADFWTRHHGFMVRTLVPIWAVAEGEGMAPSPLKDVAAEWVKISMGSDFSGDGEERRERLTELIWERIHESE